MGGSTNIVTYVGFYTIVVLIHSTIAFVPIPDEDSTRQEYNRVYRQAGYVYNKPNVSFNLPSRPTTVATQAPNVDRTQAQQVAYEYPAPSNGAQGIVNIGYSTSTTSSSTTNSGVSGYSYDRTGLQSGSTFNKGNTVIGTNGIGVSGSVSNADRFNDDTVKSAGYSYKSAEFQTGNQGSVTGSGYSTQTQISAGVGTVSTNAPKYLPPLLSGVEDVSVSTRPSITVGSVPTAAVPSATYLPPISSSPPTITPRPSSPNVNVPFPTLNTAYLPQNPFTVIIPTPAPSPQLPTTATVYLPPAEPPKTEVTVSVPAATYLPPSLR